ncbi:hypothetical protein BC829DRAFT_183491 [Chytridium lagenaria]|nr:hypothetical protein BC829DRAFT_183491 [Chytridium lagenaria]
MIPGVPFDGMKTCASNVEGFQCDEFPPAASEEAGTMDPREMSSMCMPGASNMAAGGMLSHIDDGATFKYVLSSTDAAVLFQLCWDYMIFSKLLPSSARPSSLPAYKERTTKSGRVSRSYAGLGSLRAEAAGWAHEFVNELRGDGFNAEELAVEEAVGRSRVAAPMARKMTTVAKGASGNKAAPAMSASNAAKSADGVKGQGKPVDLKAFLSKMSARFGKLRAKVQAITAKISARMKNAAKAVGDGFKKMIGAAKGAVRKGAPSAAKGKV